jgi:thioredoxin 1
MNKVIKFSASWCPPCRTYDPIFDKVAQESKDAKLDIQFEVVDIEDNPEYANQLGVRSLPTTVFVSDDGDTERVIGIMTENEIKDKINA